MMSDELLRENESLRSELHETRLHLRSAWIEISELERRDSLSKTTSVSIGPDGNYEPQPGRS